MSILRRVGAFVVAWGPLLAGCAEGRPVEDLGEARLADRNGSTGSNGADAEERDAERTLHRRPVVRVLKLLLA